MEQSSLVLNLSLSDTGSNTRQYRAFVDENDILQSLFLKMVASKEIKCGYYCDGNCRRSYSHRQTLIELLRRGVGGMYEKHTYVDLGHITSFDFGHITNYWRASTKYPSMRAVYAINLTKRGAEEYLTQLVRNKFPQVITKDKYYNPILNKTTLRVGCDWLLEQYKTRRLAEQLLHIYEGR